MARRLQCPDDVPRYFEMEFYYIRSLEDLEKGTFGVLEPIPEASRKVEKETSGLCVWFPGSHLIPAGFGLAMGRDTTTAFYLNFMALLPESVIIAVCNGNCRMVILIGLSIYW